MGSSNWLRKGRSLWLMALLLAGAASAAELNPPAWNSLDHPRVPFVENRGQVPDAAVRFYARTFGGTVYVMDTGAVLYALPKRAAAPAVDGYQPGQMPHLKISGLAVLRESFAANQICAPVGLKAAGTVVNSIRGQDPAVWQNNLATYAAISLGQIQEGVELELRAHGHSVEKIFTVAPGADPARIRVTLEGAAGLKVKACGELEVLTELGPVCFSAPVAWQLDAAGNEISVPITYLAAADSFGFALGAYDATRPLWIDPLLASTFIGGSGADYIYAVAVEHSTSNVIVAGATDSLNFPGAAAAAGDLDVFIAKFDHNMTNLLAATYFGGSGEDVARALAVSNSIYVAGYTESADLPGATGSLSGERDAFVARFNTNLTLLTASYLGGTELDEANALALDSLGKVYVGGYTESEDFPTVAGVYANYNGAGDGFVALYDSSLADLQATSYLGGTEEDAILALAVSNYIYVAGYTYSADFPATNGAQTNAVGDCDGFVARFTAGLAAMDRSTFIGGDAEDRLTALCLDKKGVVYLAGLTYSLSDSFLPALPTGNNTASMFGNYNKAGDAFVMALNNTLGSLNPLAATYLGGSGLDVPYGIAVSTNSVPNGRTNVVVVGYTASSNFPLTTQAYQQSARGAGDAFVAVLRAPFRTNEAEFLLSRATYLGGAGQDVARAVAITPSADTNGFGTLVIAGYTASTDFPVYDANYNTRFNLGACDGFLTRLDGIFQYGTIKWQATNATMALRASPAMSQDGTIYIASRDGKVYGFRPSDGANLYSFTAGAQLNSSPAIGTNGLLYVGDDDGKLHALDLQLQQVAYYQGARIVDSPAIDMEGNVYCGDYALPLIFNKHSPDLSSQVPLVTDFQTESAPALGTNQDIYIPCSGGKYKAFLRLNKDSGAPGWEITNTATAYISAPALSDDGRVYFGLADKLLGIDIANGSTAVAWTVSAAITSAPVIGKDGRVYVGAVTKDFYAFDPASTNSAPARQWDLGGSMQAAAALGAEDTVYVVSGSSLYSLNAANGSINWYCPLNVNAYYSSPLIGMDGTIYVGAENGQLLAIRGPVPPELEAPWPRYHHDMMNTGQQGFDQRPPAPEPVWASRALDSNSVALSWGAVPYVTAYEIYRSASDAEESAQKIASTASTNYLDNIDVNPGDIYYYWIRAKTPLGLSALSASTYGGTVPLRPEPVSASKGEAGYTQSILITWGASAGATGYQLWRSAQDNTNLATLLHTSPALEYEDAAIDLGFRYYYWVKATNAAGESSFSTVTYGGTPPAPPQLEAGKGISSNYVDISWTATQEAEVYALSYHTNDQAALATLITNTAQLSYRQEGLMPCRPYYYWVRATNEFGYSAYSTTDSGWRALLPPEAVDASDATYPSKIHVSWIVGNTNRQETTAHQVYRSLTDDPLTAELRIETAYTEAAMTNYTDLEIVRGQVYYYWVRAKNAYGVSAFSPGDAGGTSPSPPTDLTASKGLYGDKVALTWNFTATADSFEVYRGANGYTQDAELIASVRPSQTSYNDITTDPGMVYYYWVRAVAEAYGASSFSVSDTGWRPLSPPAALAASDGTSLESVAVTWSETEGATAYEVWRSTVPDASQATKLTGSETNVYYHDTTAVAGTIYYYWAKSKTPFLTSAFSPYDNGHRAVAQVDIGVADFIFLPTALASGSHPACVSYRLANYGTRPMEPPHCQVTADIYLSPNAVFGDEDDIWLGAAASSLPLPVGASVSAVLTPAARQALKVPALPAGDYYVFVQVQHSYPSVWSDPVPANNIAMRVGQKISLGAQAAPLTTINDYSGDGRSDLAVYHAPDGRWYVRSVDHQQILFGDPWGGPGFRPVVGNYDGRPAGDQAMYHEESGTWFIKTIANRAITWQHWWGAPGYQPVPGDYDGDGLSDLAVYGEQEGCWYVESLASGKRIAWAEWWGAPGYQPVPGDYDGDGKADFAVYHAADGLWYIRTLGGQQLAWAKWWGGPGYQPVPGDYDGDGISDLAVYHEDSGYWFIQSVQGERIAWGAWWGAPGCQPVPGDYNGDGIYDLAVYHEASGLWYIRTLQGSRILYDDWWGGPGYKAVGYGR